MEVLPLAFFFFLPSLLATSQGANHDLPHEIHPLRPQCGAGKGDVPGLSCVSWRFGVETNSIIGWKTVPEECEGYVGHYMLGKEYRKDSEAIAKTAFLYARRLNLVCNDKDIWIFDIDDTTLSNLPYYAQHGFGVEPYNPDLFNEWINAGIAPALPETLKLYKKLLHLGFNIVFLTGRSEEHRIVTENNLKGAGFHTWKKLILKDSSYSPETTTVVYKSCERKKLEKEGYKIIGNIGDQWSDLLGTCTGYRTFKLPDPMYYIS